MQIVTSVRGQCSQICVNNPGKSPIAAHGQVPCVKGATYPRTSRSLAARPLNYICQERFLKKILSQEI